jgi:hypothetical protein
MYMQCWQLASKMRPPRLAANRGGTFTLELQIL